MTDNPWESVISESESLITPKTVLKKQADLLTKALGGKVRGEVKITRTDVGDVVLEFNALVPTLGGYRATLYLAKHGPVVYPCRVRSDWLADVSWKIANDAGELEAVVQDIVQTPELQKLVSNLYAQARG